jgi:hypothetical protein
LFSGARARWEIRDVGSSNGTEVDGIDVARDEDGRREGMVLRDGAVIKLGTETTVTCRVEDAEPRATEGGTKTTTTTTMRTTKSARMLNSIGGVDEKDTVVEGEERARRGKRDAFAFDEPEPNTTTPGARAGGTKRGRVAFAKSTTAQPYDDDDHGGHRSVQGEPDSRFKSKFKSKSKAESSTTAVSVARDDVPTVEEYAKRARDAALAALRAEAQAKISTLRAKAQSMLHEIFSTIDTADITSASPRPIAARA